MCASLRSAFLLLLAYLRGILFLGTPAVSVFLLIFPVTSASIFRELLSNFWVSWGTLSSHVPVASMAGSCLILSCFSLGNIQQQRPNKLSGLLLGDVELQTQISDPNFKASDVWFLMLLSLPHFLLPYHTLLHLAFSEDSSSSLKYLGTRWLVD